MTCGTTRNLEFHHPNEEDWGKSHGIGGWKQLYRIEYEIATGVEIELQCKKCHEEITRRQMNGRNTNL